MRQCLAEVALTGRQEVKAIADVALVASEQQPAVLLRLLLQSLRLRYFWAVRDAASNDHCVVVAKVRPGPHLPRVRGERASIVLVARLVVEIVRLV